MTDDKWEELVANVSRMAKITRHETLPKTKEISTPEGMERIEDGTIEEIEFISPSGKMKITRWVRPRVEDVKILSHRRVEGATLQVKRSETETTATENLYKWNESEEVWEEQEFKL